jgi:peroxiredoxin
MVDKKAPDFTLKGLDGKEVELSKFKGKIVLLHFFATFSKVSQKQLPQMEKLHQKYKERGLVVIGITVEKDRKKLQQFARQNKLSYPILLNAKKVLKDYKLGQIPDVCSINKEGVISSVYVGFSPCNEEKTEAEVGNLLETISQDLEAPHTSGSEQKGNTERQSP